jgi:hypothetical protein
MGKNWRRALLRSLSAAAALWLAGVAPGMAADAGLAGDDPPFLSVAAGVFDALHNNTAGEFRAEYRFADKLLIFKPFVGAFGTTDKSFYGYGGFRVDIYFGSRIVLMPNAAVGYFARGSGKNLGGPLEFRTGAELAWRFDDRSRLGLSFNHISNAGIYKTNPGEEELAIVYSIPFDLLK